LEKAEVEFCDQDQNMVQTVQVAQLWQRDSASSINDFRGWSQFEA